MRKHLVWVAVAHPLARKYVQRLLGPMPNIRTETRCEQARRKADPTEAPALLVLEVDTLKAALAGTMRELRVRFPNSRVLAIGESSQPDDLCGMLHLGIRGFIPYDRVEKDLPLAVAKILEGHVWVPGEVLEGYVAFASNLSRVKSAPGGRLTDREATIVGLLRRRLSNKEIGSILGISERTVRFHLENVFSKLGARDRHSVTEMVDARKMEGWASGASASRVNRAEPTRPTAKGFASP